MESLPTELVIQILSNTSLAELEKLCSANKRLSTICKNNKHIIFTSSNDGIYKESLNRLLVLLQKLKQHNVFEFLEELLTSVLIDNEFSIEDCAFIYGLNIIYQLVSDRDILIVLSRKIKDHKNYKYLLKEIYDLDNRYETNIAYTSGDDTHHEFNFKRFKNRLLKYILNKDVDTNKNLYPEEAYMEFDETEVYDMVIDRIQAYRSELYGKNFYKNEKVPELKEFDKSIAKNYESENDDEYD